MSVPDAIFATNNDYGIPCLDIGQQADYVDGVVKAWGSLARKNRHRGTWHFYTDDYKFTSIWDKPDAITETKAITTTEVNYSLNSQMPLAVTLYRIYQKRWLARYWQSTGMRVFVDLNVPLDLMDYNMLGVPVGWSAFSTRAFDREVDDLIARIEIAKKHCDSLFMLVVGGGDKVKQVCYDNQLVWIKR